MTDLPLEEMTAEVMDRVMRSAGAAGALVPVILDFVQETLKNQSSTNMAVTINAAVRELARNCITIMAAKETGVDTVTVGGGVAANDYLRLTLTSACQKAGLKLVLPEKRYCTDNAAMIAIAGWFHYQNGERASLDVAPVSRLAEF